MKQLRLKVGKYDLVISAEMHGSEQWVALRPLCEAIGLAYQVQHKKISENPQFSCHHMVTTGSDGKTYEMLMIPVKQIGMWICNINARKVKPEMKDRLIECQKELQWVLHTALTGEVSPQKFAELQEQLAQALQMITYLGSQVNRLTQVQESYHYLAQGEASAAGTRLAAQRMVKKVRSSPH